MNIKTGLNLTLVLGLICTHQVQALSYMGMEANPSSPNAEMPKYFLYETRPGDSIQDKVKISNSSEDKIDIRVYAVETEINAQKQEVLKPYQGEAKDLAKWINFDNKTEENFSLDPNQSREISFTINVPQDVAKEEYRGGIMVEKLNSNTEAINDGVVIKTNGRVGIKTFLTVTDNPREIPKLAPLKDAADWRQTYFYVSLGIFLIAVGILGANSLKKKRQAKKHRAGGQHHSDGKK